MKYIIFIFILLGSYNLKASHIVGGEIYYDYLGNDNYRFFISMYRDCHSNGAGFDSPLRLSVYNSAGNLVTNVSVPYPGSNIIPVVFNNPCVTPPTDICTENALYSTVINLPQSAGGYTVTYQRCCRTPSIINLINPGNLGFTLTCKVPGAANAINSSPRFIDYPPLVLCNNEDLIFDHSAIDPDGDQLVYSLTTPYHGGGNTLSPPTCFSCVAPSPASAPPYALVPWLSGYTPTTPLGPGSTIAIDPVTGLLTASPNLIGKYVVGIKVDEIRNGVVINSTVRDFIFEVFNCVVQLSAVLPNQEDLPDFVSYCQGYDINFVNNSFGGTNYYWDFGDPTSTTDNSTSFAPSYTYPADGNYQAMLIVNPGWPCTDTTYMDILVNHEFIVNYTSNDSLCIFGNSFDFAGNSTYSTSTYSWEFGNNATPTNATGQNVTDVQFSTTGFIPVTVNAENSFCSASYTDSVFIFPEPIAEIILPENIECNGLDVQFGNNSQNSIAYDWDFGDPAISTDISIEESPLYIYNSPGTYTVTLVASSTPTCSDTVQEEIIINIPLTVEFTSQDSLCVKNNSFDFIGQVTGPIGSVFTWDFGSLATPTSSNNTSEFGVTFLATGSLPITLTGAHGNCFETVTHPIYIYQEPQINFLIEDGLQCTPFNAQFLNLSFAETSIAYTWDFGDGHFSNDASPNHVYNIPGNYPITLTIMTAAGCIDTLTLTKQDLVEVHPKPTSEYTATPLSVEICNSEVEFIDQSQLADSYLYWFDDSTFSSTEMNPTHLFLSDGNHHTLQIVTSEFGCKDSSRLDIYVEPFTIFVPNAFTPNDDKFNQVFKPIVYFTAEEWLFEIYNRWGELIFSTTDQTDSWDGKTPSGEIAQDGVYVWKITYISCEPINPETVLTGTINLLR